METNAACCLLQTMQQGFGLSWCICKERYVMCIVCVYNWFFEVTTASCLFFSVNHFLSWDQSMFKVRNLSRYILSYIYIYIYSHPQTDSFVVSQLFSVARHARFPEAGIETRLTQTPIQDSTTQPRGNLRKRRKFKCLSITFVLFTISA